jgi:nucleoside phosphorylase
MIPRVSTFFSHSYWPEDREVNEYFWKLFWEAGFAFTVAPRSGTLSIPHVELSIRRSASYAAVVTHRPEVSRYLTSPRLVFEYGLAVQADKPRLVFIDRRAARHHYEDTRRLVFDRDAIARDRDRHVVAIRQLHDLSVRHAPPGGRERPSVGLLLPHGGAYREAMPGIREVLARAGCDVAVIDHETPNQYQFIVEADRHDFVLIDVCDRELPSWLHPLLHGRLVPMVRLLHHRTDARAGSLPRLMLGHAIETVARSDELAIWWTSVDELVPELERVLCALRPSTSRTFRALDQGMAYFDSLGRSVDARVFVSNADSANDFARELCQHLATGFVPFFHHVFGNVGETGSRWPRGLRDRLRASQLFVPLITRAYWDSDVCREELRIAREHCEQGRLRILAYYLEPADPSVPLDGRALHRLPPDQRLDRIVLDIDGYLTPRSVARGSSQKWWHDETQPQVDIAFVTVLREEYDAVLRHLDWSEPVPATDDRPNRHEWRCGEISPAAGGLSYRVVVGLAGQPATSSGLLAVAHTVEAFRPRYMLLVGIAGGLGGPVTGDVVVADRICGCEFREIDRAFRPRPDWVCPTDAAIVGAANALSGLDPDWSEVTRRDSVSTTRPRLFVGPIVSGDRRVDDLPELALLPVTERWPEVRAVEMEGIGAVQLIRDARDRGCVVSFGMVRGISERAKDDADGRFRAADAAAALAVHMIRRAWSRPPRT